MTQFLWSVGCDFKSRSEDESKVHGGKEDPEQLN